uniref:Secreted protein n=1 Tax=Ascaris lumbricoides TaxID=6252 RepID=A0A0M3HVV9_ASCLU
MLVMMHSNIQYTFLLLFFLMSSAFPTVKIQTLNSAQRATSCCSCRTRR